MDLTVGDGGLDNAPDPILSMLIALNQQMPLPSSQDVLLKPASPRLVEAILAQTVDPSQPFAPQSGYEADGIGGFVSVVDDLKAVMAGPNIIAQLYDALRLDAPRIDNPYSPDMPSLYVLQGKKTMTRVFSPARRLYDVWNARPGHNPIVAPAGRRNLRASVDPVHAGTGMHASRSHASPEYVVNREGRLARGAKLIRIDADDSKTTVAELLPNIHGDLAWHHVGQPPPSTPPPAAVVGEPVQTPVGDPPAPPSAPAPTTPVAPVSPPSSEPKGESEDDDGDGEAPQGIMAMLLSGWTDYQAALARDLHDLATAVAGADWDSTVEYLYRSPDGSTSQIGFLYAADGRSGPLLGDLHVRKRREFKSAVEEMQADQGWRVMVFTVRRDPRDMTAQYVYEDAEVVALQELFSAPDDTALRERLRPTRG